MHVQRRERLGTRLYILLPTTHCVYPITVMVRGVKLSNSRRTKRVNPARECFVCQFCTTTTTHCVWTITVLVLSLFRGEGNV